MVNFAKGLSPRRSFRRKQQQKQQQQEQILQHEQHNDEQQQQPSLTQQQQISVVDGKDKEEAAADLSRVQSFKLPADERPQNVCPKPVRKKTFVQVSELNALQHELLRVCNKINYLSKSNSRRRFSNKI